MTGASNLFMCYPTKYYVGMLFIYIDNSFQASLERGEETTLFLAPGQHEIEIRVEVFKSKETITVSANESKSYTIKTRINTTFQILSVLLFLATVYSTVFISAYFLSLLLFIIVPLFYWFVIKKFNYLALEELKII